MPQKQKLCFSHFQDGSENLGKVCSEYNRVVIGEMNDIVFIDNIIDILKNIRILDWNIKVMSISYVTVS